MKPDQQAKARRAYSIDMFTSIPENTTVFFERLENGNVIVKAPELQPLEMNAGTFDAHFIYYKQTSIFDPAPPVLEPTTEPRTTASQPTQEAAIKAASAPDPASQPAIPPEAAPREKISTRTAKVVFIANGENAGTYGPLCFLESFPADKDINEKCERFVSWDCNIYTSVDLYRIQNIKIPYWMTEQEFLTDFIKYKFAIGLAPEFTASLEREQWNKFKNLSEQYQYFINEYFTGSTKNEFKQSLRRQIIDWLNSPYDHKRPTPLSPKQFEIATRYINLRTAKNISTSIYYRSF